jgi:hypothetical protein
LPNAKTAARCLIRGHGHVRRSRREVKALPGYRIGHPVPSDYNIGRSDFWLMFMKVQQSGHVPFYAIFIVLIFRLYRWSTPLCMGSSADVSEVNAASIFSKYKI